MFSKSTNLLIGLVICTYASNFKISCPVIFSNFVYSLPELFQYFINFLISGEMGDDNVGGGFNETDRKIPVSCFSNSFAQI